MQFRVLGVIWKILWPAIMLVTMGAVFSESAMAQTAVATGPKPIGPVDPLENQDKTLADQSEIIKQQRELGAAVQALSKKLDLQSIAIAKKIPSVCPDKEVSKELNSDDENSILPKFYKKPFYIDKYHRFLDGDSHARDEAVRNLVVYQLNLDATTSDNSVFVPIDCNVMAVSAYYEARAGRQQGGLDFGASVSALGAAGFILSKAGSGRDWANLALAPMVVTQFNANEPTRDLYHAGSSIIAFISSRYRVLNDGLELLDDKNSATDRDYRLNAQVNPYISACEDLNVAAIGIVNWPEITVSRPIFLAEVARLQKACLMMRKQSSILAAFVSSSRYIIDHKVVSRMYIDDILDLNRQLVQQEQGLAPTPGQVLSSIIASPFVAVGSVISSQDLSGAVKSIKSTTAINALEIRVRGMPTANIPITIADVDYVSADVLAHQWDSVNNVLETPANAVGAFNRVVGALNYMTADYNRVVSFAQIVAKAEASGKIVAKMDPTTHVITISFVPDT